MDSRTFVVVENIRQADGVYVPCIYSHARWSLCDLYLPAYYAAPSLCSLYLPACQVEFTWPVFTRMPGRVYVACIDSHARSSLCALYLLACHVEFMWPYVACVYSHATSSLCALSLLAYHATSSLCGP